MCFTSHFQLSYMKSRDCTLICIAERSLFIQYDFYFRLDLCHRTQSPHNVDLFIAFYAFPSHVREYYYHAVIYIHMGLLSVFVTSPSRLSGCHKAKLVVDCAFIRILMIWKLTNSGLVYNYFIWSMIQRGSDTSFTNLWRLLLYIQSLLHYIENAQENKKNTILAYNIAKDRKRIKWNEEKVCVCVCVWMLDGDWLVH